MAAGADGATGIHGDRHFAGERLMAGGLPARHDGEAADAPRREVALPGIAPLIFVSLADRDVDPRGGREQLVDGGQQLIGGLPIVLWNI